MQFWQILGYGYLALGFFYALWVWLFKGSGFFSIPLNTIFGPIYILGVIFSALRWKKKNIYNVFQGKKAVIFDLDGTIIDSQPSWNQAIENVKKKIGMEIERNYPSGLNTSDKWVSLISESGVKPPFTIPELAKMTNEEFLRIYTDVEPHKGFQDLIEYLKKKGLKVALASNADRVVVDEILKRIEADSIFDAVLTGDEVKKYKPHPEIYLTMAKQLGVKPKDVVVFEDSTTGSESSVAAGMETIIIWDGEVSKLEYPKEVGFYLDDFDGLDETIEKSPRQLLKEAAAELSDLDEGGLGLELETENARP